MFLPHRAQVRQHRVGIAQAMHGQRRARNRSLRSYHYRNHRVRVLLHRPISGSAAGKPGVGGPVRVLHGLALYPSESSNGCIQWDRLPGCLSSLGEHSQRSGARGGTAGVAGVALQRLGGITDRGWPNGSGLVAIVYGKRRQRHLRTSTREPLSKRVASDAVV